MVTLKEKFLLNRAKANELSGVKTLNFWGAQLSDISLLREVPNAEVINASANNIEYLEPFSHCTRLKELYLRRNSIKDIKEVLHLKDLKSLRYLWLSGNPFCEEFTDDEYRLFVLKTLPHLKKLDNVTVTSEQLKDALRCGYDIIKGSQESSTTSSSGELLPPIVPPDDSTKEDETEESLDFEPSKLEENSSGVAVKSQEDPDEHPQDVEISQDTTCSYVRSSLGNEIVEDPECLKTKNLDTSPTKDPPRSSTPPCDDETKESSANLGESSSSTKDSASSLSCDDVDIEAKESCAKGLTASSSAIKSPAISSSPFSDDGVATETKESEYSAKSLEESALTETSLNEVEEKLNEDDETLSANPSPKEEESLVLSSPFCKDLRVPDEDPSPVEKPSSSAQDPRRPLLSAGEPCPSSTCRNVETDDNEILDEMNKIRAELGSKPLTAEKFYCSNQKAATTTSSTTTMSLSSGRKNKMKKKNNLLTATLALVEELDEESLYLVKEQIEEQLQQIISSHNTSVSLLSSSTSSLDQSIGEISLDAA